MPDCWLFLVGFRNIEAKEMYSGLGDEMYGKASCESDEGCNSEVDVQCLMYI